MPGNHPLTPKREESALVVIDPQTNIFRAMESDVRQKVVANIKLLISSSQQLKMPVLLTEQYPKGLGKSLEEIQSLMDKYEPIEKLTFSCCGDEGFLNKLKLFGRTQSVVLCGIETHVCVLQTTLDLLAEGYKVYVIADAVCSRRKLDWEIGLRMMDKAGAVITTSEILIFQLLGKAGTEEFKAISRMLA